MSNDEEPPITSDEVQELFEKLIGKLELTCRETLGTDKDIQRFVDAMQMFDNYYDRLLQKYYDAIEAIEFGANPKRKAFRIPGYAIAMCYLKDIPLVKQRWRRRKKPL